MPTIKCQTNDEHSDEPKLHLINCGLEVDPEKNHKVPEYFESQLKFQNNINTDNTGHFKTSFRGRPLNGKTITLPENYTFAKVTKEETESHLGNGECDLVASGFTDSVTYWNLDRIPSSSDPMPQVVDFINFAQDVHAHVNVDETS